MNKEQPDHPITTPDEPAPPTVGYGTLFVIFLKAGFAFGGGLGILAVLEDELVSRRRLISREEFLTLYGIGRIVPSGTMTALAVAFGHRLGGMPGTAIALTAMVLPALVITIILTAAYDYIQQGPLFDLLPATILPAALAFIAGAALKLGRDLLRPSWELVLAVAAFVGVVAFDVNPALLLVAGGVLGAFLLRNVPQEEQE